MAEQKSLIGTRTQINLANAYVSESCAYTRYTFFAKQATKDQYYHYADLLNETADNELHHAKIFLKFLNEGGCKTDPIAIDAGVIGSTVDNLKVASQEEEVEGFQQYMDSAKVAEEEGFEQIASQFRAIAEIEAHHKERFDTMVRRIEDGTVWKSDKPIKWQCLVCGYISEGLTPPDICPACLHPYQHTMRAEKNY